MDDVQIAEGLRGASRAAAAAPWGVQAAAITESATGRLGSVRAAQVKIFALAASVVIVLALVGIAAVNSGSGRVSVPAGRKPPTTGAVQACVAPRQPEPVPAGGWIPSSHGFLDYDLEGQGRSTSNSPEAVALADRALADLGHGFKLEGVFEYFNQHCGVDFDIEADTKAGAVAFIQLIQLRRAVNSDSWPILGNTVSTAITPGVDLIASRTPDASSVTELAARTDGLTSWIQVRSSTGPDPSGWPTTLPPPPETAVIPAPLRVGQVRTVVLDMLAFTAEWK